MARRVLVTGERGFVGRQVVAALRRSGAHPVALRQPRADLRDADARAQVVRDAEADILIHAAWVTDTGLFWDSAQNAIWTAATLDLVRRFAASGGRRVVLVGSCAEYDWTLPSRAPWRESRPCRPRTAYGAAKLAAWNGLAECARGGSLSVANARVFIPVGVHEAPGRLLPSLIRAVQDGTPLAVGPADLTRDFLDVRDAGEAIARIALADIEGPLNVGSGRPVNLAELARLVGGDDHAIRLGARAPRDGEPLRMVADIGRLCRETGFAPRYDLAATVAAAIAAQQDQLVAA